MSADADSLPHFSSKVLVRRMGKRVGQDSKLLSAFISDWASEMLRRVRLGEAVAMQRLGFLRATTRKGRTGINPQTGMPITVAARTFLQFASSNTLRERVARGGDAITTSSISVDNLLSEFPTKTERFVIEAKDWMARLGIRTGSSSHMAKELESRSDVPLPDLLACIVTAEESSLRHLPAQPIATLDELEQGAEEARYTMQAWDGPDHGLLPFAKDETGEYWYFTHHEAPAGEVRVLQLDGEDSEHTYSQWLADTSAATYDGST